jgi:PPOX class probable F420-dependent enzyme
MAVVLPDLAKRLLDTRTFFVVSTVNPDGSPQSSVIWVGRDGDDVLFSTIRGRRKTRNMERDPRVSLVAFDPADPYTYVEIRGTVSLVEEGGDDLIDAMSRKYDGKPWSHRPTETRVVCRVTPTRAVVHR